MKKTSTDLSWLPAHDDWDFRAVRATECRIACHWEYSREMVGSAAAPEARPVDEENGPTGVEATEGWPIIDLLVARGAPFPKAWASMTDGERRNIIAAIPPLSPLHVRSLEAVMQEKAKRADGKLTESLRWGNEGAYVVRPGFTAFGVESVVKEFEKWARKEAKKYDRSARAKAAEPPFDLLKWLAVRRLDRAREKHGLTYGRAQRSLQEYRAQRPVPDENGVFPNYASHGAWCKAGSDAERFIIDFVDDPYVLLGKLYAVF